MKPSPRSRSDAPEASGRVGRIDVHLLGRLRVERAGRALPGLTCGKARELLAYLLLHRQSAHRREALADRLWGAGSSTEPRKALRQALWHLQSALGAGTPMIESLGSDWICVDPSARLWLDLAEFESAWSAVEAGPEGALAPPACSRAREALGLYRGELLEGSGWAWCLSERLRLREMFLALADRVMGWCLACREPAAGAKLGFDILRHDPAREKTHQQLMRLFAVAGDRGAALRQYERCVSALREELGVEPSRSTRELLAQIREDRLDAAAAGDVAGAIEAEAQPPVAMVLDRLRQLRELLSEVRHEVHVEIEAIERALDSPGQT